MQLGRADWASEDASHMLNGELNKYSLSKMNGIVSSAQELRMLGFQAPASPAEFIFKFRASKFAVFPGAGSVKLEDIENGGCTRAPDAAAR